MPLTIDACAAQHHVDRKEQQDRVAIFPHPRHNGVLLAIVADGMGGHTGGALAAEQVVHTARTNLEHFAPGEENPRYLLENSMHEAHTMIKASRFINEKDPHSTAVAMVVQPGHITWGYCGDSRLYHFHGKHLQTRTVDHSYVEHLVASGRITPLQALTHPNRNVLMTSLGGENAPRFDFAEHNAPSAGDNFILCSDGIWAYFSDDELGCLLNENSAREACQKIIRLARERASGSGDNLSLVVIRLQEATRKPGHRPA